MLATTAGPGNEHALGGATEVTILGHATANRIWRSSMQRSIAVPVRQHITRARNHLELPEERGPSRTSRSRAWIEGSAVVRFGHVEKRNGGTTVTTAPT